MEPKSTEPASELAERIARLEADVAWLVHLAGRPRPDAAPTIPGPPATRSTTAVNHGVRSAPFQGRLSPIVGIAGIGALIFLAGVVFFFRWAIQEGWIGPMLRVALGLIAGSGLTIYASRMLLVEPRRLAIALLVAGLGTLHVSFRVGSVGYGLYPPSVGFVSMAFVTLVAGVLSARTRSGGVLTVSLVSGLITPLLFVDGVEREVALAVYLAVMMSASIAVVYRASGAAQWQVPRWTAIAGTWLLLLTASANVARSDASVLGLLLVIHLALAAVWVWLPRKNEKPAAAGALWAVAVLCCTPALWLVWKTLDLPVQSFAAPVSVMALVNLSLVAPIRRRMGGSDFDWSPRSLAIGHLALAGPVAMSWHWVAAYWGVFSVALARNARGVDGPSTRDGSLRGLLAAAMALAATLRWSQYDAFGFSQLQAAPPFVNEHFVAGALASYAWYLLTRGGGSLGTLSFLALQFTANLTMAIEGARVFDWVHPPMELSYGPSRAASVVITLAWAVSGACQWMWGLAQENSRQRAIMAAGYVLMACASVKLIGVDLARANTPLRALAFLAMGSIGMTTAVLAHRKRGLSTASRTPSVPTQEG